MGQTRSSVDVLVLVAAVAGAAVIATLVTAARFDDDLAAMLPPLPPKPTVSDAKEVLRQRDYSPAMYRAYIEEDAREAGVEVPRMDALDQPLNYHHDDGGKVLKPKKGDSDYDTSTLTLSVHVQKLTATSSSGSYRTEHLVLRITNKTSDYLAYHVDTAPSGGDQRCTRKGDFEHNAMALKPHESVERTECIYQRRMGLKVKKVETLSLFPLGYQYVSRLYPPHIGVDARPTRGHRVKGIEPCADIPEQAIRLGMEKGTVTWRDVVDYYARHRCETYLFPVGYRAFAKASQYQLPVSAKDVAAQAP